MKRRYQRNQTRNVLGYKLQCQHCQVLFWSAKPDSKYHAPKCRVSAYRKRVADKKREQQVKDARRRAEADQKAVDRLREKLDSDTAAPETNRPKRPPQATRGRR